ncbi:MAG: tautomerase family protein [Cyanobacteria bacterium J06554_6]
MPQVKIYGLKSTLKPCQQQLSDAIHQALMTTFKTLPEKRFQRFIWFEPDDFVFPDDRSNYYTIIEVSLFTGRTLETRQALIRALFETVCSATPIATQDLEITLFESPAGNWGLRGITGDRLNLSYPINI